MASIFNSTSCQATHIFTNTIPETMCLLVTAASVTSQELRAVWHSSGHYHFTFCFMPRPKWAELGLKVEVRWQAWQKAKSRNRTVGSGSEGVGLSASPPFCSLQSHEQFLCDWVRFSLASRA